MFKSFLQKQVPLIERLQDLLPYRVYDPERGIVLQPGGLLCLLEMPMLTGASESLIRDFTRLLQTALEEEISLRIFRITHPCLQEAIATMASEYRTGNPLFDRLADNQQAYYQAACEKGLPAHGGRMPLLDSRLFLEVSLPCKPETRDQVAERCVKVVTQLKRELKTFSLDAKILSAGELLGLLRFIFLGSSTGQWNTQYDPKELLHHQVIPLGAEFWTEDKQLVARYQEQERRITTFVVEKWPEIYHLSQGIEMLASVEKRLAISVPHMVSMAFKLIPQAKAVTRANTKYANLKKLYGSKLMEFFPRIKDEFEEWSFIRQQLLRDETQLTRNVLTLSLFAPPTALDTAIVEAQRLYSYPGLILRQLSYVQLPLLLGGLPGVLIEGYWEEFKKLGLVKTLTLSNTVNLSPLLTDWKGTFPQGFVAPGFHGQYASLDYFKLPTDNRNVALAAGSGAGKSVLVQTMVTHALATGGQVFVIDKGGSYEKLCTVLKGHYVDATRLRLNPFVGLSKVSANQEAYEDVKKMYFSLVRDLIGIMVSPEGDLDSATRAHLLTAVQIAFREKGDQAKIDDVKTALLALNQTALETQGTRDPRLTDAITVIEQYTTQGLYGEYFNASSDLSESNFIVLEMNALENNPDLLKAVLFSLINTISQAMYLGPRARKKICVIDEAWALLSGNNTQAALFIEQGFRTSRKHGGSFVTITQGITDYFQNKVATACWNASDIKIFMRQNNDALKRFVDEHPTFFSHQEVNLLKQFQPAAEAGFSALLLKAGSITSAHRLFLTPPMRVLFSTKAEEVERVSELMKTGLSMWEAVSQVANEAGYEA